MQGVNLGVNLLQLGDQRDRNKVTQGREDQLFQLNLADRERNIRREDVADARQVTADGRAGELHEARMQNQALQTHVNQFSFVDAKDKASKERLSHAMSFMESFYDAMDGNDEIDGKKFISAVNGLFDELIGEGKEVIDVHDYEEQGVMLELGVDDGKGKKKSRR